MNKIISIINIEYYIKCKIFNSLIIILLYALMNIQIKWNEYNFDPQSLKIKEFENSLSNTFNCKNYILSNPEIIKKENPDVSVIITVYNQANCFYSALRSVQNQSLKNIEIIIIDDCSLDNITEVIKNYIKEDKRIIYIRHESNDGKIKSRSDGIRLAKGKYITIIDGDDALINSNILYKSYTIAKLTNLDVVEFEHAFFNRKNYKGKNLNFRNIKHLYNRIIYQPELEFKFVDLSGPDSNAGYANRNIVSKLIKNEVFKNVLEYIGANYTEDYLLDHEDTIMSTSLFKVAKSYYLMNECGYYVANNECNEQFVFSTNKICKPKNFRINNELDSLKYLNFLIDKSKGKKIENDFIYKELITIDYYKKLDKLINSDFLYVYSIIDKIYENNLNSKERKKRIMEIKNRLVEKESFVVK